MNNLKKNVKSNLKLVLILILTCKINLMNIFEVTLRGDL